MGPSVEEPTSPPDPPASASAPGAPTAEAVMAEELVAEELMVDGPMAEEPSPDGRPRNLRRRLVSGGIWVVAARVAGLAGTILANVLLARMLTTEDFGAFGLVTSLVNFLALAAMFGLNFANVRFISEGLGAGDPPSIRRMLKLGLGLGVAATAVAALLSWGALDALADRIGIPRASGVVPLTVALMAVTALHHLIAAALRGFHELRFASLLGGQQPGGSPPSILIFMVVLVAVVPFVRPTLGLALGLNVLVSVAILPIALAALARTARDGLAEAARRPHAGPRPPLPVAGLLVVCLPLLLTQVLATATKQADIWIAGAACPAGQLALYVAARRVMMIVAVPLGLVNQSVISSIPELRLQGRTAELERILRVGATIGGIPSFAALIVLILLPGPLLGLLFGPFYRAAAMPLVLLALGQFVFTWTGCCELVLMMAGREKVALAVNAATAVLMLVLGPLATWRFGITGLAAASTLVIAIQNIVLWLLAWKLVGVWTHAYLPHPRLLRPTPAR